MTLAALSDWIEEDRPRGFPRFREESHAWFSAWLGVTCSRFLPFLKRDPKAAEMHAALDSLVGLAYAHFQEHGIARSREGLKSAGHIISRELDYQPRGVAEVNTFAALKEICVHVLTGDMECPETILCTVCDDEYVPLAGLEFAELAKALELHASVEELKNKPAKRKPAKKKPAKKKPAKKKPTKKKPTKS